jgi:peptidyl-tRNA hydrolase, PTH1 family
VSGLKIVCGLGNPGDEYEGTRHNVGWVVIDEARRRWQFGSWQREGRARIAQGRVAGVSVRIVKPITYMNRSGGALGALRADPEFDIGRDLLVVVDDVALEVGRLRIRPGGSAGGHNGLKSIEAALGTKEYPRMRIGVGATPPGIDQADWVLSSFGREDEAKIRERLPVMVDAVEAWIADGTEMAANAFNGWTPDSRSEPQS